MSNRYSDSRHNSEHRPADKQSQNNQEQKLKEYMAKTCKRNIRIYNTFRSLWGEHSFWTRSFIISAAHKLPDLKYVTQRLLRNPDDFAVALQEFFTREQSDKFGKLLRDHLVIASKMVDSAKMGDTRGVAAERKLWYENAEDIAKQLASMNKFWSEKEWTSMMFEHLRMVENEAILRLTGRYVDDIALFDKILDQTLHMGDEMAEGIIAKLG